ncbi:MAG: AAA family ATPase [Chloroflexi bacterium HGW-Chloroflexi-10]|nr:MAG: AAA family ATPase [Chloroflexi bacterium HGW-Chloroflexi-10]
MADNERELIERMIENIEKVIIGKRETIELLMVALLSDGHVLLEDVPGVGKTMLARSLAVSLEGAFKRVQCTPDLLPNDITGVSIFNQQTTAFEFRTGPIFVNVLLVDEINRATPRTQSALLEAMQERQVTVDGMTYALPNPFLVLATQNPIEYEGTFPLPEAQLDRFLMRLSMGYPSPADEEKLLNHLRREHPVNHLGSVVKAGDLLKLRETIWEIHLDETLAAYIVGLVTATRQHSELAVGGSPRASLALYRCAQAYAWMKNRDYVLPDDVQYLAPYVITHRLMVQPEAMLRGHSAATILQEILQKTDLPLDDSKQ